MADSQSLFKTLRRFGSRLSLNANRRWSLPAGSEAAGRRDWQVRYDNRPRAETADAESGYVSASVELVMVRRRRDSEQQNDAVRDADANRKSLEDADDGLATCHETLNMHDQDPASSAVALPDPEAMRRRPLPPLPPRQQAHDGRLLALSAQLKHLSHQGWYWGPLTLEETQIILADRPDGSYLVRDSHNEAYLLAIGLRHEGRTVHSRISHCNGRFTFSHYRHGGARSIEELISRGMSVRGRQRQLLYPVSRLMRMRSLQEYCRFAIRRLIAIDRVDDLEIPLTLKAWLKENPY